MAHGLYEGIKQLVKNTEQGVKETVKQATKQTAKFAVKAVPALAGGALDGAGVDMGSKALTGNTWGENASAILSHRYGINVPTLVVDMTDDAFRKALKLKPRSKQNTYITNSDGSVSYNMDDYVNSVRKNTGGTEFDVADLGILNTLNMKIPKYEDPYPSFTM